MPSKTLVPLLGLFLAIALAPVDAAAEVVASSPSGFAVRNSVVIKAVPERVYEALVKDVGSWWNSSHTFFGSAKNLSIEDRPGGCFCERTPDGRSVKHLEVVLVHPGRSLSLRGGLGPMLNMGVQGAFAFTLTAGEGGTNVELRTNVGGFSPDGLQGLAPAVDRVLAEQLARLKTHIEGLSPR